MVELRDEEDGRVALIMGREELPLAIEALMRAGYELRSPSQDGIEEPEDEDEEPEDEDEEPEEPEDEEPERRGPVRRRGTRARRLWADATIQRRIRRRVGP